MELHALMSSYLEDFNPEEIAAMWRGECLGEREEGESRQEEESDEEEEKGMKESDVEENEEEGEKMRRWKSGVVVRGDFAEMRNGAYFRKYWALVKLAFDMWEDQMPETLHRGVPVKAEMDRFRRDLGSVIEHYREVARRIGAPL